MADHIERAKAYAANLRRDRAAETLRVLRGEPAATRAEMQKVSAWAAAFASALLAPKMDGEK